MRQPTSGDYILVPQISSEQRQYIPMDFCKTNVISTNGNLMIPYGTLYELGILSSIMHNDWMSLVAGRLKSDYSYSPTVVYNTFPWPQVSEKQRQSIEKLAKEILLARAANPGRTLAELYDPEKMPANLLKAHLNLDLAVDKLYQSKPFTGATERLRCLLARYEQLVAAEGTQKTTIKTTR